ncbi:unnamed protein product [Lepeophtheirus salmonis]|uniref:(salmon louse) hypothetical protein n=1 Tax=Lepeophtheirus salmonis TaxID=72036 RepID=A0A7R8H9S8_LEPSM|nr:unnamed protein product [Lepeophtheirus salmonis]CAF2954499.1 unnamed protein product [Lepeophtheirus salmonis]
MTKAKPVDRIYKINGPPKFITYRDSDVDEKTVRFLRISKSNVSIIEELNNSTRNSLVLTLEKGFLKEATEESMLKMKSRNIPLLSSVIALEKGVEEGDTDSINSSIVSLGSVKSNTSLLEESNVEYLEDDPLLTIRSSKVSDECCSQKKY